MLSLKHSADSLVCRPCRNDIARVLANPAYIPRWRKGRVEGCSSYCSVKDCNSISFTQTSLCSNSDDLKITHGIEFTTECIPIPTPLCKNHFVRLVGTVYFKKHASGFDTPSPSSHFLQFADADSTVQHIHWIDDIRQNIADRITFDTSMVPSTDALYFHWKRTCWVLDMCGQADRNTMGLNPLLRTAGL